MRKKIDEVARRIDFPSHQNIKIKYLNRQIKLVEIAVRILERSLGRKKRKKYDAFICDETRLVPFVRVLCSMQQCSVSAMDFHMFSEEKLKGFVFNGDGSPHDTMPDCRETRPHPTEEIK